MVSTQDSVTRGLVSALAVALRCVIGHHRTLGTIGNKMRLYVHLYKSESVNLMLGVTLQRTTSITSREIRDTFS